MPEIDTDKVFKQLKKQNGEAFAHVIRDAVLLDVPNIVHILEFAGRNPDCLYLLLINRWDVLPGAVEKCYQHWIKHNTCCKQCINPSLFGIREETSASTDVFLLQTS